MADKTGSYWWFQWPASLLWIYAVCQTSGIKDGTKSLSPMTMNDEFYKSIHSEISRIADEKGSCRVEIRSGWKKKAEPADRWFCAQGKYDCGVVKGIVSLF